MISGSALVSMVIYPAVNQVCNSENPVKAEFTPMTTNPASCSSPLVALCDNINVFLHT